MPVFKIKQPILNNNKHSSNIVAKYRLQKAMSNIFLNTLAKLIL
jgi:hypothetical protein